VISYPRHSRSCSLSSALATNRGQRLARSLYHAGGSKGIANKGEQSTGPCDGFSQQSRGAGVGSHPICLIPKATVSPSPNFPDLARHFAHGTYIEVFRIVETSIEDSKSRREKWLAALPLGHRDHGTEPLACPLRRSLESKQSRI
jgi:hypothetical protein